MKRRRAPSRREIQRIAGLYAARNGRRVQTDPLADVRPLIALSRAMDAYDRLAASGALGPSALRRSILPGSY